MSFKTFDTIPIPAGLDPPPIAIFDRVH